jgi:hypothetical protein
MNPATEFRIGAWATPFMAIELATKRSGDEKLVSNARSAKAR